MAFQRTDGASNGDDDRIISDEMAPIEEVGRGFDDSTSTNRVQITCQGGQGDRR